jgi:hypothetical protein
MKTSKIKSIDKVKPYRGTNGLVYYLTITFDNGDTGEIGKRDEHAFKVGDEVSYDLSEAKSKNGTPYFKIVEAQKPEPPRTNGYQAKTSEAGFALAWAKDCIVAKISNGADIPLEDIKNQVFELANEFHGWLKLKDAH